MGKGTPSEKAAATPPQTDKTLVASEKKYRLLIENANEIIYTLTLDGVITYASPAMEALLGHSLEQVMGKRMEAFIHPDDISRCKAFLETVVRTGQRKSGIEFRVLQADGSWRWLSSSGVPERDETGAVVGYQGIARDITEKRRLLDTLAQREDHFRMLFEQAPIPYQSLDIDGNILEVNSRWLAELGYERAEAIGKWFGDFLQSESKAAFLVNFPRFKAAGSVTGVVFNMIRKDGSAITVSFNGRISHDKHGAFRQTHC
ncbi:MAG: PAS domain S-box protein, partial [Spirochaetales bacterium]